MTLLENWDISWKAGLDSQFPRSSLLLGGAAALMWLCLWDLSRQKRRIFQEKSLRVELGGVLEPQRKGGFPPFPYEVLGRSAVLPREGKLMHFKNMEDKGLEKYSPLFF